MSIFIHRLTKKFDFENTGILKGYFQRFPKVNLFSSSLFLFCGRKKDRLKILLWQGDGFILLYKRLGNGKFQWPRENHELTKLTPQQYRWLMEGLAIYQPKAVKNIQPVCSM